MALPLLQSGTAAKNITAFISADGGYTATRDTFLTVNLMNALNGGAATFDTYINIYRNPNNYPMAIRVGIAKLNTTDTTFALTYERFGIKSGDVAKIFIKSSNGSDTAANCITEWYDAFSADAVAISSDLVAADNLETMLDGTGGKTLSLGILSIVAPTNATAVTITGNGVGNGINITGGSTSGAGINIVGNGTGAGIDIIGGKHGVSVAAGTGHGLFINATANEGRGILVNSNNGMGVQITSGNSIGIDICGQAIGMQIRTGDSANSNGLVVAGGGTGNGATITGGSTGNGIIITGQSNGNGMKLIGAGTGYDLHAGTKGILGNLTGTVSTVATVTGGATAVNITDAKNSIISAIPSISGLATSAALATVDGKIDTVDGVVDALAVSVGQITTDLGGVGDALEAVDANLDALAGAVATVDGVADTIASGITTIDGKADNLISAVGTISDDLDAVGVNVEGLAVDVAGVDTLADTIASKADTLITAVGTVDTVADAIATKVQALSAGNAILTKEITITDANGQPLDSVIVRLTTDANGSHVAYTGKTNAFGVALFHPDAGTYYAWAELAGYSFTNPQTVVVS